MFKGHEAASVERKTFEGEAKLAEDFGSLYLNQKLSDVTFLVGGEKLHAHKTILGFRCESFEALFTANAGKKEITISNASPESFRLLLKYIYTGTIIIPLNPNLTLQVLILARQYCPKQFVDNITKKINSILDDKNVVYFVNGANDNDLVELRDACNLFIDGKAAQILSSDSFKDLNPKALHQILKRDTFVAPQTDILKSVTNWCEKNNDVEHLLAQCASLSLLSVSEIMSIVWPKLVKSDKLLDNFFENIGSDLKESHLKVVDENVATVRHGAKVISHDDKVGLLNGNTDDNKFVYHIIGDINGIVIRLDKPYIINHIRMMLTELIYYGSSYYIEVSLDQTKWHKIVDYSKYACRSVQNLYFPEQAAQYLKIVGTSDYMNDDFGLVFFEAFYKSAVPKTVNGVICPWRNVVTSVNNARMLERYSGSSVEYIVQLSQPYLISSMNVLLDGSNRGSSNGGYTHMYSIETSINDRNWEVAAKGQYQAYWQNVHFSEKIVVFIRIKGIFSSKHKLDCAKFIRCPSD